jgi:hypothetical protein
MAALVINPTVALVAYVANNLRAADELELSISRPDVLPAVTVMESFTGSDWCRVVVIDDLPAIVFGLYPSEMEGAGELWMVATDDIVKAKYQFIKRSKAFVNRMLNDYPYLYNMVHSDNQLSIQWLKYLGFTIEPDAVGPNCEFHFFWMEKTHV